MKNDLNKIKNNNKNQNLKSNINVLSSYHFLGANIPGNTPANMNIE